RLAAAHEPACCRDPAKAEFGARRSVFEIADQSGIRADRRRSLSTAPVGLFFLIERGSIALAIAFHTAFPNRHNVVNVRNSIGRVAVDQHEVGALASNDLSSVAQTKCRSRD